MYPFLCSRCLHISYSTEGLHCPHCDGDGSGTVMTANSYSAIPESGDASPVYYVTVEDASTQVSEEDLPPLEPNREASTQTSDDDLTFDGSLGFENCLESDDPSQSQASHDNDHYTIANQNGISHTNTNEGEIQNQSYDMCNAATLQEVMDYNPSTSKQTNVYEQSLLRENGSSSDEQFLTMRGPQEPIEGRIMSSSFAFTDSNTLESKYPDENLLSNSYEKVEDKQDKDRIPPPFSSCPRGNFSVSKYFQENLVTANGMAQQDAKTSNKLKIFRCTNCKRYFRKKSSFIAHKEGYCGNSRKPFKCGECGRIFPQMSKLVNHKRTHTGRKSRLNAPSVITPMQGQIISKII